MLIPSQPLRNVPPKEFSGGMSVDTANAAVKTVEAVIAEEANSGWILHSVNEIHKLIIRKKTILEFIFGWIPILGKFICPNNRRNAKRRALPYVYAHFRERGIICIAKFAASLLARKIVAYIAEQL